MFSRRVRMAALSAVLVVAATSGPAVAAKPRPSPAPPPPTLTEPPLTPEQEAAAAAKLAGAEAYVAAADRQGIGLVSLACVTPTSVGGAATINACYDQGGFLPVEARDQINGIYCGPAVGQVISNYTWAVASGANKYAQTTIAQWMRTDANGGTSSWWMAAGLESATKGSPRRPAGWAWVIIELKDTDKDGQTGDQLHTMLRSNISSSKMPLAISVKPYDPLGQFHLSSWARPVNSVGHWIAAYGWLGLWTGENDYAKLYYTDSSRDEGGSTGKFNDPVRHIAAMIMVHTRVLVW
jgi:hypothetical protein